MRATTTEFRMRAVIIAAIFVAGYQCERFDPIDVADVLASLLHVSARGVMLAGAVVALGGALLRTWATAYLTKDVVHDAVVRTERVVADGPYRFVRNPLYVGVVMLAVGLALTASRAGAAVMLIFVPLFLLRLVLREEADLRAKHAESFDAFARAVPRLLPSPWPRVPASGRTGDWKHAWMGEEMFWMFGAGLVAHAWTGRWTIAAVLAAIGIALRVVERMRARSAA